MKFEELLLKLNRKEYDKMVPWPGDQPTEIPKVSKDSKYLAMVFSEYYDKVQDWEDKFFIYKEALRKSEEFFKEDCISCMVELGRAKAEKLFELIKDLIQEKEKLVEYLINIYDILIDDSGFNSFGYTCKDL